VWATKLREGVCRAVRNVWRGVEGLGCGSEAAGEGMVTEVGAEQGMWSGD
jgi:hypothetical protein